MSYTYQGASPYSASPGYTGLRKRLQSQFAPPGAGASPPPGAAPTATRPPMAMGGLGASPLRSRLQGAFSGAAPAGNPVAAARGAMGMANPRPTAPPPAAPINPAMAPAMGAGMAPAALSPGAYSGTMEAPLADGSYAPVGPATMGAGGLQRRLGPLFAGERGRTDMGHPGDTGPTADNPDAEFNHKGYKAQQARLMRAQIRDYLRASNPFWNQVSELENQANTNRFSDEQRAQFLAPIMQATDQQYERAAAGLAQNAADRGLSDSSYSEVRNAALANGAANARSQAIHGLFQSEEQRQQMAQAQLRDLLSSVMGRSTSQAGNMANAGRGQSLQEMLAKMQQGGFDFGGLLGGLGGLLGSGGLGGLFGGGSGGGGSYLP